MPKQKPVLPNKQNYKTIGEYNASLRNYNLQLHKYNLENNPERLPNESKEQYENRSKYFNYKIRQEENKHPLNKMYLNIKDNQESDPNIISKTLRQIGTSPLAVAYNVYNQADPYKLDKLKSNARLRNDNIDLISSGLDAASLLAPFDTGMKAKPIQNQIIKRLGKEVIEDQGFDVLKTSNNFLGKTNFALGGNINNNMKNNTLTQFNVGGSHEDNIYGGIPQGQAPDGSMNTVEQGETKKKNFVYSDRIPLNEDIAKQFNLPGYTKNKTIAEASKAIDKKFKDRNDKPSVETKNTLLDRLAQAQESIKQHQEMLNQAMQANSQQIPDQMNGQVPQGMEEFTEPQDNPQEEQMESNPNAAYGGYQNKMFLGGLFGQSELGNLTGGGKGLAAVTGINSLNRFDLGGNLFNTGMGALSLGQLSQGVGASPNQNATALNGTLQGAQAGMAFGPVGAGIGAAIGLGAGIMGGDKAQREQAAFAKKQALMYNKNVSGDYAYGGKMNRYDGGGIVPFEDSLEGAPNQSLRIPLSKNTNLVKFPKDIVGSADYNTNIIQNVQNGIGVTSDGIWGPKSSVAYRNWQQINQPDKYRKNINEYGKNYGFTESEIKQFYDPNLAKEAKNKMGLTSQGYKYNGPETPNTTGLVKPETPFVEPTGVRESMENYYNNSNKNINNDTNSNKVNYSQLANQAMRLSPILSNWSQLQGMTRPNPVGYTPLRNTYQYDPIDTARQERLISQEGNRQMSAIGQLGASQGALRNAIISTGLNTTKARSAAATDADAQNRAQRLAYQQSQLGVNQYNNQLQNKAIDETRMDQGNYDTQRSKFIGAIGTELGQVGKERVYGDKVGQMFGYDENGKYLLGPDGNKIRVSQKSTNQTTELTPQQQAYLATMPQAFGGYIKTKKNTKGY